MTMREEVPWRLTLVEAAELVRTGLLSAKTLVTSVLDRLAEVEPHIRAFVHIDQEGALRAAEGLDKELLDRGPRGSLHGMPIAIKDIFDVKGVPTRRGCRAFDDVEAASEDCTVVARLRAAGAVILGKTTTHELACGVYTPPTRNPWDLERSAGGSSGGSGAAVAAEAVMGATGSDTGGSIRIPAALCGVVGIKPTYGRVSRSGVAALSWSLDHVGPLAKTVDDAELLLSVMAGPDPLDPATVFSHMPDLSSVSYKSLSNKRVGIPSDVMTEGLDPEVRSALAEARQPLEDLGAAVVDISIPELDAALTTEFAIVMAEAASHYEEVLRTKAEMMEDDVRGLLEAGMLLPSVVYLRAQKSRAIIKAAFEAAFKDNQLDALLTPTVPATAQTTEQQVIELDGREEDVTSSFVRTTGPFNLGGLPAVALPTGLSTKGLPISVQFVGRPFGEPEVIGLARLYERAVRWRHTHTEPGGLSQVLGTS